MCAVAVNPKSETILQQVVEALQRGLGATLHSCCVYGSFVRGNAVEGVSDLNLLIVLNESTASAHQIIATVLADLPQIDPLIVGQAEFGRSARTFATKFASIRRHHRVLHGVDPFVDFRSDVRLERFLCEQALRNLRLRLTYAFVTRASHHGYSRFVMGHASGMFVQFSEVLRLDGVTLPSDFSARIPILERELGVDGQTLRELLALKQAPREFSDEDTLRWHTRLVPLVDAVLRRIEERWPA